MRRSGWLPKNLCGMCAEQLGHEHKLTVSVCADLLLAVARGVLVCGQEALKHMSISCTRCVAHGFLGKARLLRLCMCGQLHVLLTKLIEHVGYSICFGARSLLMDYIRGAALGFKARMCIVQLCTRSALGALMQERTRGMPAKTAKSCDLRGEPGRTLQKLHGDHNSRDTSSFVRPLLRGVSGTDPVNRLWL